MPLEAFSDEALNAPIRRRYHHKSQFGQGPRVPLDRERRAQWRAKLKLWRRPKGLTISTVAVGMVLLDKLGQDGRLDPSISTIATLARVSEATVKRALVQLREAGFLAWVRRLVRLPHAAFGRVIRQITNAYMLIIPSTAAFPEHASFSSKNSSKGFWLKMSFAEFIAPRATSNANLEDEARRSAEAQLRALGVTEAAAVRMQRASVAVSRDREAMLAQQWFDRKRSAKF